MRGGVFLLDKEEGRSSSWSARVVGRRAGFPKSGHTGTLDPMATGLLVVLLGEAGKFASFAADTKEYRAIVRFGVVTDTGDLSGRTTGGGTVPADLSGRISDHLPFFRGRITQKVPSYSAHKHKGKPFYSYARRGVEPPARTKEVNVESISFRMVDDCSAELAAVVQAGTYIRMIAQDLGERVGCGAALAALHRVRVGNFGVEGAMPSSAAFAPDSRDAILRRTLPIESLLAHLPSIELDGHRADIVLHGGSVRVETETGEAERNALAAVYTEAGKLCGVCEVRDGSMLHPVRMLAPD